MGKGNDPCKGGDDCHSEDHLCRVSKREDEEIIRKIVRDSRFFCRKCGRAAHEEANLCKPIKI